MAGRRGLWAAVLLGLGCQVGGVPDAQPPQAEGVSAAGGPEAGSGGSGGAPAEVRTLDGVPYDCYLVSGTFENAFLVGPACVGERATTCTAGRLLGGLEGDYAFFFRAQVPAGDRAQPSRQSFTGNSQVTLADGSSLQGDDFGTLDLGEGGKAGFRTLVDIVGGSGRLEGARGHLLARGVADFTTSQGAGTYSGELCLPQR